MAKLSERDVCTKFITPALMAAGWDLQTQIREEVSFTKGRIIVRGKLHSRGKGKRAEHSGAYRRHSVMQIAVRRRNIASNHQLKSNLQDRETSDHGNR